MLTTEGDGNTPLDQDEAAGLIPTHITTQGELNEFEQANIVEGERWARAQSPKDVLSPAFLREVHRRMFDKTWEWAGRYCTSEKNIGISWAEIATAMRELCDNTRFQLDNAARLTSHASFGSFLICRGGEGSGAHMERYPDSGVPKHLHEHID